MAVTPLTSEQQTAVDALVSARRLERVPPDSRRAAAFVDAARDRLDQLERLSSARVAYDLSYDAAHDIGEALLAAHGYRTRNGVGQHETVGLFLQAVFDAPPARDAARDFDRLRRVRNRSHYDGQVVGAADAAFAESAARILIGAALSLGVVPV